MAIKDDPNARLFPLGRVSVSNAARACTTAHERRTFLLRHQIGSWELTPQAERRSNALALHHSLRIVSRHRAQRGWVWVTTESDRLRTSILVEEEM